MWNILTIWDLHLIDYEQLSFKLRRTNCDFFKCKLPYLGHFISGKGIYLLPKKLKSIKDLAIKNALGSYANVRINCVLLQNHTGLCWFCLTFNANNMQNGTFHMDWLVSKGFWNAEDASMRRPILGHWGPNKPYT